MVVEAKSISRFRMFGLLAVRPGKCFPNPSKKQVAQPLEVISTATPLERPPTAFGGLSVLPASLAPLEWQGDSTPIQLWQRPYDDSDPLAVQNWPDREISTKVLA